MFEQTIKNIDGVLWKEVGCRGETMRRLIVAFALLAISSGQGCSVSEKYTTGTMTVTLRISDTDQPAIGVDGTIYQQGEDLGRTFQSDSLGMFEYAWGWLGGGGQYAARLVVNDSAYVSVDTAGVFSVRGTKEDNRLNWVIGLKKKPTP